MKKIIISSLIILIAIISFSQIIKIHTIEDLIFKIGLSTIVANINTGPWNQNEQDALRVVVCGSRSPLFHKDRANTCLLVVAGKKSYLIDVGSGSINKLGNYGINFGDIESVIISHLHSDHITDLGEAHLRTWINRNRPTKLTVFGPDGIEQVVEGYNIAFGQDNIYRNLHHGMDIADLSVSGMSPSAIDMENPIIISDENTTITAFEVIHEPVSPALGFRIDYKDRSIVISGDTIKDKNVEKFSKDVDVLFHEAQSNYILNNLIEAQGGKGPNATILKDIQTYHTTPTEAAEIAKAAKVGHLVFYHLTPAPRNAIMERVFTRGVEEIFPKDWTMAKDGLLVSLPTGTDDINISYLD